MANTVIQLKYSNITNKPPLLNVAEPAYSNVSGTLWIDDGSGVVAIGGKAYTDKIDAAASAATANVLVKRDTTGNASFNYVLADVVGSLYGNAQTATKLQTTRYFNLSGDIDSVSYAFDGTSNVEATLELTNTGVSAGSYGGTTNIPVFTVDVDGRITSAANVSVGTTLSFAADTANGTLDLLSDTLDLKGGDGISTVAINSNNTIIFDVDSTVVKTDRASQTINGDIAITGNLTITGNTTQIAVTSLNVTDPIIHLSSNNNVSDIIDIGFVGGYYDGTDKHTGVIRKHGTNDVYIFTGYDETNIANGSNLLNIANPSLVYANVRANLIGKLVESDVAKIISANVTTANIRNVEILENQYNKGDIYLGASGNNVIRNFGTDYLYIGGGNTTNSGSLSLAAGNETSNARINLGATSRTIRAHSDRFDFTQFNNYTGQAVRIDTVNTSATSTTTGAIQVTGGVGISGNLHIGGDVSLANALTVSNGGTGATSFTVGSILVGDSSSSIKELANTGTAGTYGSASYLPVITTDAYGRVSGVSNTAVNIDTSAVVSGTLGVARGGTGASSFTVKGVIISDSSSTTGAFNSLTSSTEGHVLQINSSGAPTFAHLNGGTF
jgi:hypothetical protein